MKLIVFVENVETTPVLAAKVFVTIDDAIRKIVLIVLAWIELVKKAKVDKLEGMFANPPLPDPGGAPLIEDTQRDKELM